MQGSAEIAQSCKRKIFIPTSLVVWVLEKAVEEGSLTYVSSDAADADADTITPLSTC